MSASCLIFHYGLAANSLALNDQGSRYDLDVALLRPGAHVLGMELGQGFCGGSFGKAAGEGHTRAGLLSMRLYGTGTPESKVALQTVVTDHSWTASAGGAVLWDST